MKKMFSTKEVAQFLDVNEKVVYSLISEKGLPATKVTGKWLFPIHLVEQWLEMNTINYPESSASFPPYEGLLILAGSNDLLLDKTISLFNTLYSNNIAVFGNLGSMGGLKALRQNLCHIAACHLLQDNEAEYNFDFAAQELDQMPAVVNFCRREQGIMIQKGNPKNIGSVADLAQKGIRIVNRNLGSGTRLLFDRELKRAEIKGETIDGYHKECNRHLDAGLEVLADRADACPGIRTIASILNLDFIPIRWERYDLLIQKDRFFDQGIQLFIGLLHDTAFRDLVASLDGYDVEFSGKMVYPTTE